MSASDRFYGEPEFNPDTRLPEWIDRRSTVADAFGLYVLTVSGRCSCGASDWRLAPDWMVPGTHMTATCDGCLGTMEYSEAWERVDRVVDEYADLKPDGESA